MTHTVFVYGSLKRGQYNNPLLATARFIGPGITSGRWRLLGGGFPVALPENHRQGAGRIVGELYEVDDVTFKRLDQLEANGRMYQRHLVSIDQEHGVIQAWMYVGLWPARWFHSWRQVPRINGRLEWGF